MTYPDEHESGGVADGEEQQFDLAEDDADLPWLEADEYEEEGSFDYRLIVYALLGLAVVAALLAAIWYFTRGASDPERVPDGSTIEAPEGAYKQRPENPGGTEVEGTGDQAYQVAEGGQERGRIAGQDEPEAARPSIDLDQRETEDDAQTESPAPANDAVYVQIGAYGNRGDADAAWSRAVQRYSVLSGMRNRVIEGEVNGARVFRLQVATGDRDTAEATCRAIREAGGDCYIR